VESLEECRAVPSLGVEEDGRSTYKRRREEGRKKKGAWEEKRQLVARMCSMA